MLVGWNDYVSIAFERYSLLFGFVGIVVSLQASKVLQRQRHVMQFGVHPGHDGIPGELAAGQPFAAGDAGENRNPFFYRFHRVDMKLVRLDGIDDIRSKHQIRYVLMGNHHPLRSGQATTFTDIIESFNLFVDASDRLNLALLVDRAGHGDTLFDRNSGN